MLIPFNDFNICRYAPTNHGIYENGFIVLIKPEDFFVPNIDHTLECLGLTLGTNLLVFYETRKQWNTFPPRSTWTEATSRKAPLGGQYVARVPATTSEEGGKIMMGFCTSRQKGAGIRVYEYADATTIKQCRLQLEYLFWKCKDIHKLIEEYGLNADAVNAHIHNIKELATAEGLTDDVRLKEARIIDSDGYTICPLCLRHISALGFCSRIAQAEGRDVPDLTVTEISLFHIRELRTGEFNHRPYNLGWGHHFCNVVVKDSGIEPTLQWMRDVIKKNDEAWLNNK